MYGAYDTGYETWYGLDEMDELGGEGGYDPAGDYWYGGW